VDVVIALCLLLVAVGATATVLSREPAAQAVTLSAYGLVLAALFLAVQAPDVALSQLAVGTVVVPLMVVLTVAKSGRSKR
jgi:uncharacterized MnhB-related membrane protein